MEVRQKFEYQFVRLGEGMFGAKWIAMDSYQQVIEEHAREGWRLVQVFAPGTAMYGKAKYFEIIMERTVQ